MVFKKWNIVYTSKKVYNDLKNIENNIKPFCTVAHNGNTQISIILLHSIS